MDSHLENDIFKTTCKTNTCKTSTCLKPRGLLHLENDDVPLEQLPNAAAYDDGDGQEFAQAKNVLDDRRQTYAYAIYERHQT